jgi:hypothetical protein
MRQTSFVGRRARSNGAVASQRRRVRHHRRTRHGRALVWPCGWAIVGFSREGYSTASHNAGAEQGIELKLVAASGGHTTHHEATSPCGGRRLHAKTEEMSTTRTRVCFVERFVGGRLWRPSPMTVADVAKSDRESQISHVHTESLSDGTPRAGACVRTKKGGRVTHGRGGRFSVHPWTWYAWFSRRNESVTSHAEWWSSVPGQCRVVEADRPRHPRCHYGGGDRRLKPTCGPLRSRPSVQHSACPPRQGYVLGKLRGP